jgi:predicted DNA-binding protein with PD1-like motif
MAPWLMVHSSPSHPFTHLLLVPISSFYLTAAPSLSLVFGTFTIITMSKHSPNLISSTQPLQVHAIRFGPHTDIVPALMQAVASTKASSCCVLSVVGSLEQVTLRMASASRLPDHDQPPPEPRYLTLNERVEIVSLVGTISQDASSKHLHMVGTVV